jgi:hypothetical protein
MENPFDTPAVPASVDEFDAGVSEAAGAPATATATVPRIPSAADHLDVGIQVLRDLLRVETRTDRVRRILRIWESKVSTAIRSREVEAAEAWLRAVVADVPEEHADAVSASFAALSRPALIDELLQWIVDADALERCTGLLAEWGDPVVRRMIELMAVDDPPVHRRHMVDVLTVIGRSDSRLLAGHVTDHRWFIVRNVAIALGKSGRLTAFPVLRTLTAHEDPRVRVEALRGLTAIDDEGAVTDLVEAFEDGDRRVRLAAVSLLRACPSRGVVVRLSAVVRSGRLGGIESVRLVEVIGERNTSAAAAALEEIASRRGHGKAPKAARRAAKQQLARRQV